MQYMDCWLNFLSNPAIQGLSDRLIFTIGTWFAHVSVFWTFNIFLQLCRQNKWFEDKRIDKEANPPDDLKKSCITGLLFEHFILHPISLYLLYPLFISFGMVIRGPLPSGKIFIRDFIVTAICNDVLFYFAHRLFHYGPFYKHIHKKHHEFKATIGIASEYAHPIEGVIANLIPTLIGPVILGSHVTVLWIWLMYRIYETVDTHSGYVFDWSLSQLLPFTGGRERHYFHHSHNVGCFGSAYLDTIFGTDKAFRDYQKKKRAAAEAAASTTGK